MGKPSQVRWLGVAVGVGFLFASAALVAQDAAPAADAPATAVVGNKGSKTFHLPSCTAAKKISAKNKVDFASADEAAAEGYKPCRICKPTGAAPGPSKGKAAGKKGAAGKGAMEKNGTGAAQSPTPSADDKGLKFSRDIAPILVGNCIDCHNAERKRGKLDLTTFQKLMTGSEKRKIVVPGKPDESAIVLRIRGDETPKMPQGAQRNLAPEAIAKIEQWVKEGAVLDAGTDPSAELAKIAPTPEMQRAAQLSKLSVAERDKLAEHVGLERLKKAASKAAPEVTSDKHFVLFANLPKDRVKATLKGMETQYQALGRLLGPLANRAIGGPEKISLYVFNDRNSYVEFVRANENREVESDVEAHGNLAVETPYLAAVDPLGGHDDPSLAAGGSRKGSRAKREEEIGAPERSLLGLFSEQLGIAAANRAGKPPRWLSAGLGAFLASQVEPRSVYYRKLRGDVVTMATQGWTTKATEALGGEAEARKVRAIGFSMIEWLRHAWPQQMSPFLLNLIENGGEKLDDTIQGAFSANREQFLQTWGSWVEANYPRGR